MAIQDLVNDLISALPSVITKGLDTLIINENMENIMEVIPNEGAPLLWSRLSSNPFAIPLIEKYPEYVNFVYVLWNPNKEIIPFLTKNFGKIDWDYFSQGWKFDEITGNVMLKRENRLELYKECLKFLGTRVKLDFNYITDDIWSH
mgnify:CR=1 FL=1